MGSQNWWLEIPDPCYTQPNPSISQGYPWFLGHFSFIFTVHLRRKSSPETWVRKLPTVRFDVMGSLMARGEGGQGGSPVDHWALFTFFFVYPSGDNSFSILFFVSTIQQKQKNKQQSNDQLCMYNITNISSYSWIFTKFHKSGRSVDLNV